MELWQSNIRLLNSVFFTDEDVIQKNTPAYEDFMKFLEKYERFKNKIDPDPSVLSLDNKYGFPQKFNKRYKISYALSHSKIKERYKACKWKYDKREDSLSLEQVIEFKQILLYYYDFLQRQNFSKVMKLKRSQNNLPIKQYEKEIIYAVESNQVVIIAGDTGCGKSTQAPQYLLNAGYTKIACTQPRRIACISLAKRVAYETFSEYMTDIAYQVRFETSKNKATKVLFLTEGLLLRQFQSDPTLSMYDVIVVDEVHERHINGDFLLGVLKCLLQQRTDLKLILMSATINIQLFASYFEGAPVIQVPGRLHKIELQYLPHFLETGERSSKSERLDPSPYLKVMQLIDKKYAPSERGDLLIFMSGMAEIASVVEAAKEYAVKTKSWIVLPLHSSLSIEDQDKIFDLAPEGVRKCIVATNIAETSITIDGIRFIADSGKVKEMLYDPAVKMKRLQEFWISQASAEQRKGRAGRTGPGVCFRLYSKEDYDAFVEYSTPEIHRVTLDTLVLQMASLGLHDATRFPFIEPPEKSNIVNATYFLKEQNAITKEGILTPIGKMLSQLPVDIVIGKMLIMGSLFDLVDPIIVIASALSVQSPFTKKFGYESDYDVEHRRKELYSEHGDPFTLLAAYDEWILVKADRKANSKKWCKRRGFEEQRFYEMSKLKRQFEDILKDHKLLSKVSTKSSKESRYEKNQLRKLKRENPVGKYRKRKILKLESLHDIDNDNNEKSDDDMLDIQDIDFKLRHDLRQLEKTSRKNRNFSYREIFLLKLIISSGLYPQFVLPDENNVYRKSSEQVFHSKDKSFLMLHPTGMYNLQPEFLESLYDSTEGSSKSKNDKRNCCKEFLMYVSLLETNKAYVMNTMKVAAFQTLSLLSTSVDTNSDCTKIVFNEWIEVVIENGTIAQNILSKVIQLRKAWDKLLHEKLLLDENSEKELSNKISYIRELEEIVSVKLAEFIDADIDYKLRRVTSDELQYMYVKSPIQDIESKENPNLKPIFGSSDSYEEDLVKGGVKITPFLTFGCLKDEQSLDVAYGKAEYLREHYHCANCGEHLICTLVERIKHDEKCMLQAIHNDALSKKEFQEKTVESSSDPMKETYFCDVCSEEFRFTKTEILKHKVYHAK